MEILVVILLFIITFELGLILLNMQSSEKGKEVEDSILRRRELVGEFRDPLLTKYRTNSKGQYVPIKPARREEDEEDDI